MNKSIGSIATVAVGALLLTACGQDPVKGDRDDVRYDKAQYVKATRVVNEYTRQCQNKTKQVRHTQTTGTGNNRRTRVWYTTEHYQDCKNVKTGSHNETYKKKVKDAKYCVELDNVGGKSDEDDVWFNVSSSTYYSALGKSEGTPMKFNYNHKGC